MKQTKILFVAAECAGFAVAGGLADVAGSLPKAIMNANKSFKVKVVLPLYKKIMDEYGKKLKFVGCGNIDLAWRSQYVGVFTLKKDGVEYYFVDNKYYFDREGLYGHYDDGEKYAYFSKSIFKVMEIINFYPNIIHANDWHTALVNIYLDILYKKEGKYMDIKSVFTIHNIEYQGVFGMDFLKDVIGIDKRYAEILEYNGLINLIKGAIVCSDLVTTVSPRYAREISTAVNAYGLENIIRLNLQKLVGIINGIDYNLYNPADDPAIKANYDINSFEKKVENKLALQEELGLQINPDRPLVACISRLVSQKGMELVVEAMQGFIDLGAQVVVLGTGEMRVEEAFRNSYACKNENVRIIFAFNSTLAHKIYAGSDIFMMPSKFEPCGLSQMIASRYGSVPVVRATGGLYDTIADYYDNNREGNGFVFKHFNSTGLYNKTREAIELFKNDREAFTKLAKNCMNKDFSWNASAKQYIELFKNLLKK